MKFRRPFNNGRKDPSGTRLSVLDDEAADRLAKAIAERDAFLNSLPPEKREKLLALQDEIDERLAKAGNQNNRLTVISDMMWESMLRLNDAMQEVSALHEEAVNGLDEDETSEKNRKNETRKSHLKLAN